MKKKLTEEEKQRIKDYYEICLKQGHNYQNIKERLLECLRCGDRRYR